jgi:hypothetical protein
VRAFPEVDGESVEFDRDHLRARIPGVSQLMFPRRV